MNRRIVRSWARPVCAALAVVLVATSSTAVASEAVWQAVDPVVISQADVDARVRPADYLVWQASPVGLLDVLYAAPLEFSVEADRGWAVIELPMPDGTYAWFEFVESPIMAPELAELYPEIRTYAGQGLDDPTATAFFDLTPEGFHAQIRSSHGTIMIDPFGGADDTLHLSYYKRDYPRQSGYYSEPEIIDELLPTGDGLGGGRIGETLRTYRLACAATGEYTAYHGGTKAQAMAAIVTTINRVRGIYKTDLGIDFQLVANNDQIVYENAATDPYTNNDGSAMLNENQANLDSLIGTANYDIGHVFSTGSGGIATLGCVCHSSWKARGTTGKAVPVGDPFDVDYVAHEFGHQFGANHTFNSTTGSCSHRSADHAYEPGSGTTIMAYAGICAPNNTQNAGDPYFHWESIREIRNFVETGGGTCSVNTATGNNDPTVEAGDTYTIPKNTPFVLTAVGNDPDGHAIKYCWEQADLGPAMALTDPDNGQSPLFRSWSPTTSPSRTFPRLSDLLANTLAPGEKMPVLSRTMNFRCTVRDNQVTGGGTGHDNTQVIVHADAGPFVVTAPNASALTWSGQAQTVTWDVASTDLAPISAAQVNILLSLDGGQTYPHTLAANTPNDGSEAVTVPNGLLSPKARVKVEAVGNIFFDISNYNFTVDTGGIGACCHGYPQYTCTDLTLTACTELGGTINDGTCATYNCVEPWCAASSSSCAYAHIGRVVVGAIDNDTACTAGGYVDYSAMSTNMAIGTGYPITVTDGPPSYTGDQCGIWVDWNHNYVFTDPGEQITVTDAGGGTFTATITPPAGTPTGATRMRVRIKWTGDLSPCGSESYGETEDYTINVTPPEGACCALDGTCSVKTEAACQAAGGTYRGNGTNCSPNPCSPVPGACCLPDGTCQDVATAAACTALNGTFQGHGTTCATTTCTPQVGACCYGYPTYTCADLTPADCATRDGVYNVGTCATYTCVEPWCAATATTCDEFISRVQIGNIDNDTDCTSGGYADYSAKSTIVAPGGNYTITVTNGKNYVADQCGIWVDWNRNYVFTDPGEQITVTGTPGGGPYTATISPPAGSPSGKTRMRIRIVYNQAPTPCGAVPYGETEDYTLEVLDRGVRVPQKAILPKQGMMPAHRQ